MLKDLIIDYNDMVQNGLEKSASVEDSTGKYAVLIKTAEDIVGRFPIGNSTEIKQSIFAIENNDNIPVNIVDSAKYYIKQAATVNNIPTNWETKKASHVVAEADLYTKVANETVSLKIKNDLFWLDSEASVKIASDYLDAVLPSLAPIDRITMSKEIVKAGSEFGLQIPSEVAAYAHAEIRDNAKNELSLRKVAMADSTEYIEALDKLSESKDMAPEDFIEIIEQLDKEAGYSPTYRGKRYSDFFLANQDINPIDTDKALKIASATDSSEAAALLTKVT